MELNTTSFTFLATAVVVAGGMCTTWRNRSWSAGPTAVCLALAVLAVAFVWLHFFHYAVGLLAAEATGLSVADTISKMVELDVVGTYFNEFGKAEFASPAARYWCIAAGDMCLVLCVLFMFEAGRQGGSWYVRLMWGCVAFFGTLAGALVLFMPLLAAPSAALRGSKQRGQAPASSPFCAVSPSVVQVVLLAVTLAVIRSNAHYTMTGVGVQTLLMLVLPMLPCASPSDPRAWGSASIAAVYFFLAGSLAHNYLNSAADLFALHWPAQTPWCDNWHTLVVPTLHAALSDLLHTAGMNDVMWGTITGEVLNVTLLTIVLAAQQLSVLAAVAVLPAACVLGIPSVFLCLMGVRELGIVQQPPAKRD